MASKIIPFGRIMYTAILYFLYMPYVYDCFGEGYSLELNFSWNPWNELLCYAMESICSHFACQELSVLRTWCYVVVVI